MRRKERETDKETALRILKDSSYGVLAMMRPDGTPYGVPVSIVLVEGDVYFHCAKAGEKLDCIRNQPKVCLTCVGNIRPVPEKLTMAYESCIVNGRASMVEEESEKCFILRCLCEKYAPETPEGFFSLTLEEVANTGICKIAIDSITGKRNPG